MWSKRTVILLVWTLFCFHEFHQVSGRSRRSIDLNAAHALISDARLPKEIVPTGYKLELKPYPETGHFEGRVRINITWQEPTNMITLHAHPDLQISSSDIQINQIIHNNQDVQKQPLSIRHTERVHKKPLFVMHLSTTAQVKSEYELDIKFNGKLINDTSDALFRNSYTDKTTGEKKWFVASHFRPNSARKVFPCFDEPSYKTPIEISIARKNNYTALSNMPLKNTEQFSDNSNWVWDHFIASPPMSTFTIEILVSDLDHIDLQQEDQEKGKIKVTVWGRSDFLEVLREVPKKIQRVIEELQSYLGEDYPLTKIDCVALPNYQAVRAGDNWGILLFKESEIGRRGYWQIAQEMAYQWLGNYATPYWWSDAHINKALSSYLAAVITFKINNGKELQGKWPMTILYSLYYEFSKRYPHARISGMKQETTSVKTELIFRMFNYTLGEDTFKAGLNNFIKDKKFKTFFGDDVWSSLTEQAHLDKKLYRNFSVNEIAGSWITKDRLPVVTVVRDYNSNSAVLKQRVYLRDRPHDVPDQDKMLWWIPIILIKQDDLNFYNTAPHTWMKKEREIKLENVSDRDKFIIINPEEIGPFPVNYDADNWNMLARYLLNNEGRKTIPVYTRAKLLHDAWNLAYAGDLSFATALNMTLFLKYERDHLVWDPVFTMIDHIGRHIDSSEVHKKFETYVRILLTSLYEELGTDPKEGEDPGQTNLRGLSKVFLCRAGYKPCIEEAQAAYREWMESEDPDEGNPVGNQYICPVFKWGTDKEWEFGLQRVINFPPSRKQSERTYLLKTLVGCPIDSWKINRILNLTILEENGNFTDSDIYLIFSMLTGGASGYTTLFKFLNDNWDIIKLRFEEKTHLWDSLITSATTVFTTQEGLDMVSELYVQRQGEFGTAEHIIEKALKNIKEETKWSDDNLPVIEHWLDEYLESIEAEEKRNKYVKK